MMIVNWTFIQLHFYFVECVGTVHIVQKVVPKGSGDLNKGYGNN